MNRQRDVEPESQKRLDDLIAGFEDDMRHRPTPAEMGEENGAAARPRRKRKRAAVPSAAPQSAPAAPSVAAPRPVAASQPLAAAPTPPAEEPELPVPPTTAPAAAPATPSTPAPPPQPAAAPAAAPAAPQPADAATIEDWWAKGERIKVEVPGYAGRTHEWEIFTRISGDGPWLTLIHGFPTSSWDWAPMVSALAKKNKLLMFDLLGFGDSDKPGGHDWSAYEQADIVEALWRHFRVAKTRVVAHDVGDTVALELLARQQEQMLAAAVNDCTFLNGGIYTGFHRPRSIQVWLQRPVFGALIARMLSEQRFGPALAEIFGPEHQPTAEELHQHWIAVARRNGGRNYHRLIKYIPERRANAPRWEGALEQSSTPLKFIWGMADPVSGAHMADVIKERRPGAKIAELPDVGHYPQLEAPERVAAEILKGV